MRENRPFTQQEDQLIRNLYEEQNIKKWNIIARALTQTYNLPRNAKQCRDRYQQYIDPQMISQWTAEEEQKLYWLHNQIGNKWAVIAQKFPGRTDNCVKNHFYAKLRKSLRHLNKVIKNNFKKQFKQLKIGTIYKIIQALEDRFNENTMIEQQVFNLCISTYCMILGLKKQLLEYASTDFQSSQGDIQKERQLIKQILQFSKNYKRKTKKQRRNSVNGAQLFKPATIQKRIKYSSDHQSSESQYSLALSHKQPSQNNSEQSYIKLGIIQQDIRQSMTSKYEPGLRLTQKIQEQNKNQLKISCKSNNLSEMLKGIVEEVQIFYNKPERSLWQSQKSQSQKADMFDDNIRISEGLRNIQEMDQESPQDYLFRSHR